MWSEPNSGARRQSWGEGMGLPPHNEATRPGDCIFAGRRSDSVLFILLQPLAAHATSSHSRLDAGLLTVSQCPCLPLGAGVPDLTAGSSAQSQISVAIRFTPSGKWEMITEEWPFFARTETAPPAPPAPPPPPTHPHPFSPFLSGPGEAVTDTDTDVRNEIGIGYSWDTPAAGHLLWFVLADVSLYSVWHGLHERLYCRPEKYL